MKEAEVGFIEGGLFKQLYWAIKTVITTWVYCKKYDLDFNKWYGVFEYGTDIKLAMTGPLHGAESRAEQIENMINFQR